MARRRVDDGHVDVDGVGHELVELSVPRPLATVLGHGSQLPRPARRLIGATVVIGAAALAWRVPDIARWDSSAILACLILGVLVSLAEQFPIPVRVGTETEDVLVTDIVFTAALMLAPPAVLSLGVAAGIAAGQVRQRKAPHKIAFNVGHELLGLTLAEVIFAGLHGLVPDAVAAVAGMAGYLVVNETWMALVISFVERQAFWSIVGRPIALSLMQWTGNLAIGIIGAVVWRDMPELTPLLVVPLGLTYLAYRGWFESGVERDRMRSLYAAAEALSGPLTRTPELLPFFDVIRNVLGAAAVELVLVEDGFITIDDGVTVRPVASLGDPTDRPDMLVRLRPGLSTYSSPVTTQGETRGVLAVYREEELTDAERSLVDALGSQVGVRLQNCRLYGKTVDQRRELNEIIVNSSDGIFVVSAEGTVLSWNPAMERITGLPPAEALGSTWTKVFGEEAGSPADGGDIHFERGGVPRWIRYSSNAIEDGEEHRGARVIVARDVTAEVEAEQAKADFVAAVSHELRTPLTPLKGLLMMMEQGQIDPSKEERQEYYGIMVNQATRLERLITDLLDVTTVEAGTLNVHTCAVNVLELLTEQVEEFRAQAPGRPISVVGSLPGPLVLADPFRLGQVISNLLSNALKYSASDSPVELSVLVEGGQAVVSVSDRGEGIPPAEQDRVFERFHRIDNGSTRSVGGTGLGLYIAKQLVEAMQGRLWVTSEPGRGSTFSLSLPLAVPGPVPADPSPVIVVDEPARSS